MPEWLVPPKGASDAASAKLLMPTMPAFSPADMRRARSGERVKA